MRKQLVDRIQKMLSNISMNSVGKSFPANIHERRVPDELIQYKGKKQIR